MTDAWGVTWQINITCRCWLTTLIIFFIKILFSFSDGGWIFSFFYRFQAENILRGTILLAPFTSTHTLVPAPSSRAPFGQNLISLTRSSYRHLGKKNLQCNQQIYREMSGTITSEINCIKSYKPESIWYRQCNFPWLKFCLNWVRSLRFRDSQQKYWKAIKLTLVSRTNICNIEYHALKLRFSLLHGHNTVSKFQFVRSEISSWRSPLLSCHCF